MVLRGSTANKGINGFYCYMVVYSTIEGSVVCFIVIKDQQKKSLYYRAGGEWIGVPPEGYCFDQNALPWGSRVENCLLQKL